MEKEDAHLVTKCGSFNLRTLEYTHHPLLEIVEEQAAYLHTDGLLYVCGGKVHSDIRRGVGGGYRSELISKTAKGWLSRLAMMHS